MANFRACVFVYARSIAVICAEGCTAKEMVQGTKRKKRGKKKKPNNTRKNMENTDEHTTQQNKNKEKNKQKVKKPHPGQGKEGGHQQKVSAYRVLKLFPQIK